MAFDGWEICGLGCWPRSGTFDGRQWVIYWPSMAVFHGRLQCIAVLTKWTLLLQAEPDGGNDFSICSLGSMSEMLFVSSACRTLIHPDLPSHLIRLVIGVSNVFVENIAPDLTY
ncbi:hypothetical protein D3C74_432540 [compost metagenome]